MANFIPANRRRDPQPEIEPELDPDEAQDEAQDEPTEATCVTCGIAFEAGPDQSGWRRR